MSASLENLKKEIKKYEIISFDVFDTLLLRDVYKPTDIFRILEMLTKKEYGIENFFDERIDAEAEARKKVEGQEANFEEIYVEIEQVFPEHADYMKQKELDLEYEFIIANPFMKEVYNYAKKEGKTILFISDMYHGRDFIGKLLHKCGYATNNIFVSSEYRKNKGSMKLYEIARRACGLKKDK